MTELFGMASSIFLAVTWKCALLSFGDLKNSTANIRLFFLDRGNEVKYLFLWQ